MSEKYSVADLVNEIINEYNLPHEKKIKNKKEIIDQQSTDWKNYRQQVSRALKQLGIWEKGVIVQKGKKKTRYFSKQQKQMLLSSKKMYDYVRNNSSDTLKQNSKRYKEIEKIIDDRREEEVNFLLSQSMDDYDPNIPTLTIDEYWKYKERIMLLALFEKFFTPIDDKLMHNDIYRLKFKDELDLQVEDIEAEERWNNPGKYYYHEKNNE